MIGSVNMTLKELRALLAKLQGDARAKQSEIKDDTAEDAARAIETEHQRLLGEIEEVTRKITAAETAEAEAAAAASRQAETRPGPIVDTEAVRTAAREAVAAERERGDTIRNMARRFGQEALGDEHVRSGSSVSDFRVKLMDKIADASEEIRIVPHVQVGRQDETATRRDAATNALLHRHDPKSNKLTDAGRQYRGMTLLELARDMIEASGTRTRGMARDEIARRAFQTTSDFSAVLEGVTNRTLRAAYEAYPNTFQAFCRQVNATDFKDQNRVQLGEAPQLEKVNEAGEFKRGSITESKEKYRIATYGKVVAITRQVIINDDLGAFTRIPAMFGTSIATLEGDIVWAIMTANAAMADGNALFHANHKNLVSGGGNVGAPSVATVSATRKLMRQQKGLDGKTKISAVPRFLLVPTELETVSEQLVAVITAAQTDKVVPDSMRSLKPISEPRLDDASTTAWYLAANPNESNVDTIEFAYLEGQEGAYMETRMGFDVDGMEVKCRLDFGAKAIDWRGMAKNPGA
jgi:hypothetical protein